MFDKLPQSIESFMSWDWQKIEPFYKDLEKRALTEDSVARWLSDWTRLGDLLDERRTRLHVAMTQNTADTDATDALNHYMDELFPKVQSCETVLQKRLLASKLEPDGMEIPLRNMRSETELFTEANLPLISTETKLATDYRRTIGAQTVEWQGTETTLPKLATMLQTPDRTLREKGWRMMAERHMADQDAINAIWVKLLTLRQEMAANAGYDNYIAFRWKQLKRFDYTPEDAITFQQAIEKVVVPAASQIYKRYKEEMSLESVRPWDVQKDVFVYRFPALKPFETEEELTKITAQILHKVDPVLGTRFNIMRDEKLLDLENRKGKSPGGYCTSFANSKRPFIFMNAVGTGDDIRTLLHEAGHAFHGFERMVLPYRQQRTYPMEFAEVASMAMELLAVPYLTNDSGGFFEQAEATQWLTGHLEKILLFWPYMAVVDAFQHWVYSNIDLAIDPQACDQKWGELWQRFIPQIDYTGFEPFMKTGWHRKQHIFSSSFYYIEYGLAQLGAVQIWKNALQDQSAAVKQYRHALSLGGTSTVPGLYNAAGAKFGFDQATVLEAVTMLESQLEAIQA